MCGCRPNRRHIRHALPRNVGTVRGWGCGGPGGPNPRAPTSHVGLANPGGKMKHTSLGLLYCVGLLLAGFASAVEAAVIDNLGTLGGSYSRGFGINAAGQVTGGSNAAPGSTSNRGFLYIPAPGGGGTMHDLGTLGGPITFSFAINASGPVAGSSLFSPTSGAQRAYLYTGIPGAGGMMHDLGTLGGTSSRAT